MQWRVTLLSYVWSVISFSRKRIWWTVKALQNAEFDNNEALSAEIIMLYLTNHIKNITINVPLCEWTMSLFIIWGPRAELFVIIIIYCIIWYHSHSMAQVSVNSSAPWDICDSINSEDILINHYCHNYIF